MGFSRMECMRRRILDGPMTSLLRDLPIYAENGEAC